MSTKPAAAASAPPAKKDDKDIPPIVKATLQAAVIAGISNVLAQAISAYKDGVCSTHSPPRLMFIYPESDDVMPYMLSIS